jgi:hypothetical protein
MRILTITLPLWALFSMLGVFADGWGDNDHCLKQSEADDLDQYLRGAHKSGH